MKWTNISIVLTTTAIALGSTASFSQDIPELKMTFICNITTNPPKIVAYNHAEDDVKLFMNLHPEYVLTDAPVTELCQEIVDKLQTQHDQGKGLFLGNQQEGINEPIKVCVVPNPGEVCNLNNSINLLQANPNFNIACLLTNKHPSESICKRTNSRGPLMSVPTGDYGPSWWPW